MPARSSEACAAGVAESFNAMSSDGCTSTNDTVILLASGAAGPPADPAAFAAAVAEVCVDLATQMAGDAEGATKVVHLHVTGAPSDDEARAGARKVAESQLVKCSWYGKDPYWGRIASELGTAGIAFEPDKLTVALRRPRRSPSSGVTVARRRRRAIAAYMERERPRGHRRPRPRRRARPRSSPTTSPTRTSTRTWGPPDGRATAGRPRRAADVLVEALPYIQRFAARPSW